MQAPSRGARAACAALGLLALTACGPKPSEDVAMRAVFDQERGGRIEEVVRQLPELLRTADSRVTLTGQRAFYIPDTPPTQVTRVQWKWSQFGEKQTDAPHPERAKLRHSG